ncbi:MAG TPA: CDP-alcohol phosphatidyltransferase family protein [candidate division Zixibacteria bacterium]|nr:CDP-alcohol phosphatidyltransferase family protein [candidate division Zixibacteria bacterium]
MSSRINWPNVVTLTRTGLLFVLVMLAYGDTIWSRLIAAALAVVVIVGDWLDGHLARRLDQSTTLGSVLDIAADRIIESVLWVILADLDLVPVWIPVVFISRGILTDTIRNFALRYGYAGFGEQSMMKSKLGKFLTGSPLMRTPFAVLKAFSFGWLLGFAVMDEIVHRWQIFPLAWVEIALTIGYWSAVAAAIMSLVRGVPVVIEGIALIRREEARAA